MSRARHEKHDEHEERAKGGKVPAMKIDSGREEEEEREMDEGKKHGGKVKRKHGGSVEHGEGMKPKHHRLDRPGRKRGGSVGADRHPLSSAAHAKDAEGHKTDDDESEDD